MDVRNPFYPFSVTEQLQVQLHAFTTAEPLTIQVFSLQGKLVNQQTVQPSNDVTTTLNLQLPPLPAGTYLLTARNSQGIWQEKIVGFRP